MDIRVWKKYKKIKLSGKSMLPTLAEGLELIFILTKRSQLDVGDIVYFNYQDEGYVKRILGLPNNFVELKNDGLWIDGEEIEENYLLAKRFSNHITSWMLGPDEYVMLGDNPSDSLDSRRLGAIFLTQDTYKLDADLPS